MPKTFGVFKRRDTERIGSAVRNFEDGREPALDRRRLDVPDAASPVRLFRLKSPLAMGSFASAAPQVWTGTSPVVGSYVDASSDPAEWVPIFDRLGVISGVSGELVYGVFGASGGWEVLQKVRTCP
jgi:hypothetical protein